jgi:hypothetical protein
LSTKNDRKIQNLTFHFGTDVFNQHWRANLQLRSRKPNTGDQSTSRAAMYEIAKWVIVLTAIVSASWVGLGKVGF